MHTHKHIAIGLSTTLAHSDSGGRNTVMFY